MDFVKELKNVEDYLIPKLRLDLSERALYYHLLRHTRAVGKETSLFGLLSLADTSGMAESTIRERIRLLDSKGCIKIEERSAKGHLIRVLLPEEIDGLVSKAPETPSIPIDQIDFYSYRTHVGALIRRENGRCFYCFREITPEICVLDHVIAQAEKGDNSFRNVVASCHECNTVKQGQDATDFLRSRYRIGMLSPAELQQRLAMLEKLQLGQLIPEI